MSPIGIYFPSRMSFGPPQGVAVPTAMPAGNTTDAQGNIWRLIYSEDFNTDVAEGGFVTMTSGDQGLLNPSSAGGSAYSTSFKSYMENNPTSDGTNTFWSASRTLSTASSILRIRNQAQSSANYGGVVKPLINNTAYQSNSLRVICRTRCSGSGGGVMDWIGSPAAWQAGNGEFGAPEHSFSSTRAYADYRAKTTARKVVNGVDQPAYDRKDYLFDNASTTYAGSLLPQITPQSWHVWDVLWIAGQIVSGRVDGIPFMVDTTNPWTDPIGWVIQTGFPQTPTVGDTGLLEVDWITAYQINTTPPAARYGSATYGTGTYGA